MYVELKQDDQILITQSLSYTNLKDDNTAFFSTNDIQAGTARFASIFEDLRCPVDKQQLLK